MLQRRLENAPLRILSASPCGIFGHGVLAIGGDELHEGGEERSLCHAIGIEPVELGLGKSLGHIAQAACLMALSSGVRREGRRFRS